MDFTVQQLIYHWRAFRNKEAWLPFCQMVEQWLNDWLPAPSTTDGDGDATRDAAPLVLIGPSAGYTLPTPFVARFSHVIATEPDATARLIFQARFHRHVQWLSRDFFGLDQKIPNPKGLEGLFSAYPNGAFLFCNVLGQLPVILRDHVKPERIEEYMKNLGEIFAHARTRYKIASYHDRFSRDLKKPNEAIDHLTGDLFVGWPVKKEFPWRLTKRLEHQIEFVCTASR